MFKMSSKPTILLVHGSWHNPGCFDRLLPKLEAAGYPTVAPHLPSSGSTTPPGGLIEDGQAVAAELERLVEEQEKDVIVVGHSYGGLVITQGVLAKFAKSKQREKGKKGGVVRIVYLCAFILAKGESNATHFQSAPNEPTFATSLPPLDDEGFFPVPEQYAQLFYHNMPVEEQKRYGSMLVRTPGICGATPLTEEAHQHHPTSYWLCPDDQAVSIGTQNLMADRIEANTGIKIHRETIQGAAHSPFITHPEEMVKLVDKTVAMQS